MSKTTKRKYEPAFKMAVALEAIRGEKTLSQVASEHGVAPSLACARRDQLEQSAGDVFGVFVNVVIAGLSASDFRL